MPQSKATTKRSQVREICPRSNQTAQDRHRLISRGSGINQTINNKVLDNSWNSREVLAQDSLNTSEDRRRPLTALPQTHPAPVSSALQDSQDTPSRDTQIRRGSGISPNTNSKVMDNNSGSSREVLEQDSPNTSEDPRQPLTASRQSRGIPVKPHV
jgi:hypothetical protein